MGSRLSRIAKKDEGSSLKKKKKEESMEFFDEQDIAILNIETESVISYTSSRLSNVSSSPSSSKKIAKKQKVVVQNSSVNNNFGLFKRLKQFKNRIVRFLKPRRRVLFAKASFPNASGDSNAKTDINKSITLSNFIDDVIQMPENQLDFGGGSEQKAFIMLHQTNENEIMSKIGSFRLNPGLNAKRDTEGLGYVTPDRATAAVLYELIQDERIRRRYAYERKHKSLTLEQAFQIAAGKSIDGQKTFGAAEVVQEMHKNETRINAIPVVHSEEPVIGVPFEEYFNNVVDIPEYPIELFRAMNCYLDKYGVQIIDLRCRAEEIVGQPPYVMHDFKVGLEVTDAIVRSLDALHSIRTTAKYFVVYGFYSFQFPFRFYQAIVRFKPGLPIDPADWINDGNSRNEISEQDM